MSIPALAQLHTEITLCRKCAEVGFFAESSPVVVNQPTIQPKPKMMLVGQAPASPLRSKGKPFSGQAGRVLFAWLAQAGFTEDDFRARCYFTAITKCYPGPAKGGVGKGDRVPGAQERMLCQPFLLRELSLIQPRLIITVGRISMTYFLGKDIDFTTAIGNIYLQDRWTVLPLPHPSGVSRWNNLPENKARLHRALSHLKNIAHEL
jgi:uracil-DNA glycosylase